MTRLERRLRKVEAAFSPVKPLVTREERHIARLYFALLNYAYGQSTEIKEKSEKCANKLVEEILSSAREHEESEFRRHITDYVQPMWQVRWKQPDFLPPICGSEYDDWEVPNLYQRRLAVRHLPLVVRLIGPPDDALGRTEYVLSWQPVFEQMFEQAAMTAEQVGTAAAYFASCIGASPPSNLEDKAGRSLNPAGVMH